MDTSRRISLVAGVLFLITFVTSIGALVAFQPVLDDPVGYIAGDGSDDRIFFGAFLELLFISASIGTAVVLFPILRRQTRSSLSATSPPVSSNVRRFGRCRHVRRHRPGRYGAGPRDHSGVLGAGGLGVYLTVKGFRPSPILREDARLVPQTA